MTKDPQKSSLKIFEQRRNTLKKKADTLSTLCNDVCLLCFGPTGDFASFPEDPSKVRSIIERYKEASRRTANNKRFRKEKLNLSDLLGSKIKTLQKQISDQTLEEASNNNDDSLSLSRWDQQLAFMSNESLLALSGCLESKIQAIDARIGFLDAHKNHQQQPNNGLFSLTGEGFLNGFALPFGYQQFNGGQDSLWQQDQKLNPNYFFYG